MSPGSTYNLFVGYGDLSRSCIGLEGVAESAWNHLAVAPCMWHRPLQYYRWVFPSLLSIQLPSQQLILLHLAEQLRAIPNDPIHPVALSQITFSASGRAFPRHLGSRCCVWRAEAPSRKAVGQYGRLRQLKCWREVLTIAQMWEPVLPRPR